MLLILGATGHIGHELVSILSSNGVAAVAVTRDPEHAPPISGIRWVRGDLVDPRSLSDLFRQVHAMFLLTGNGADLATLQSNAIQAARNAGVKYVVKLSALGASDHSKSPIGRAHYEVETELIASGLVWTILRPHVFMQNLLDQAPSIARDSRIYAASGEGKIPFIDTRDIAAVAAVALTQTGHEAKKYVLTGPQALSYHDVAQILSQVVGRPVEYVAQSPEETRDRMVRAGASAWAIESMPALSAYQRAGGPTEAVHDTVEKILARPPRSFAEFAKDHASIFQANPSSRT
jgi:uncharacterized protein YbjT (DUF2867 family)